MVVVAVEEEEVDTPAGEAEEVPDKKLRRPVRAVGVVPVAVVVDEEEEEMREDAAVAVVGAAAAAAAEAARVLNNEGFLRKGSSGSSGAPGRPRFLSTGVDDDEGASTSMAELLLLLAVGAGVVESGVDPGVPDVENGAGLAVLVFEKGVMLPVAKTLLKASAGSTVRVGAVSTPETSTGTILRRPPLTIVSVCTAAVGWFLTCWCCCCCCAEAAAAAAASSACFARFC